MNNTLAAISNLSDSTGTGNGTVMIAVAPYAGLNPRSLSLTIAGSRLTNSFQTSTNQITLDASGSMSSSGGSLGYSWTNARGSDPTALIGALTAVVTAQFPTIGTYQLILTVTDLSGNTATANVTVQFQ